jgi:hypothetical protein
MLKTRILNGIFFTALSLTGALMLYIYIFVHPAYRELLVGHAEDESVRYVAFLVHAFDLAHQPLEIGLIPDGIAQDVGRFSRDEPLIKLRVFDATGKIVFSTLPKEIGRINKYDYFHKQVASGEVYSKTVCKDNFTAEMEIVQTDLIETYVPIMADGQFRGAIETYFDFTQSSRALGRLEKVSMSSICAVLLFLNCLLYYALSRTGRESSVDLLTEKSIKKSSGEIVVKSRKG